MKPPTPELTDCNCLIARCAKGWEWRRRSAFADVLEAARRELDLTGKGIKKVYALVPLVDRMLVYQHGLDLHSSKES